MLLDNLTKPCFAARHLPRSLRHLHIKFSMGLGFTTRLIEWWSGMSKDLPLETLSLYYSDYDTNSPDPYPHMRQPLPMPYVHPTIYKLSITVYELPLAISTHILDQLPKHLVSLALGVWGNYPREIRACPKVPDQYYDKLPESLSHMRSTVFGVDLHKRWHRELAKKEGRVFDESIASDPLRYTYWHLPTFPDVSQM